MSAICPAAMLVTGLVIAAPFLARWGVAAEVSGVAAGGREVYLQLAPGESLEVGAVVPAGKSAPALTAVEVVGARVRLEAAEPVALRAKDRLDLLSGTPPSAMPLPPPPKGWKLAPPGLAGRAEILKGQAETWRRVLVARRPWVDDVRRMGGQRPARVDGQVTLVGVGLLGQDGRSYALARLGNRLDVLGIAGTPLSWRHDLAVWLDSLGGVPSRAGRRTWQVRQAELSLATAQGRSLGGALGRTLVPQGAGAGPIDGAALRLRLAEGVEASAFGGLTPSLASSAPDLRGQRLGAAVVVTGQTARWQGWAQAGWSLSRQDQAWDPHLLGLAGRLAHASGGEAEAELEVAAGAIDLQGTAYGGLARQDAELRPVRGLFGLAGPRLAGWQPRVRYSYYRAEITRELALALALPAWSPSRYHQVFATLDTPRLGRFEWQLQGWGSWTSSADVRESRRAGASLQTRLEQWPSPAWSWQLTLLGQDGSDLRGGSVALSGAWMPNDRWHPHARLRYALDRLQPSELRSESLDARLGVDWGSARWLVGVSLGARQTLSTSPYSTVDWLDATLLVSHRW